MQCQQFTHVDPSIPSLLHSAQWMQSTTPTLPLFQWIVASLTLQQNQQIPMDDQKEMISSARVYEIGRRRSTDDDSDPNDVESEEEDEDDDGDMDSLLGPDLDRDGDSDADDMSNDDDSVSDLDDDEDDGDFIMDGGGGILEIVTDVDEDDDDSQLIESYTSDDEDDFVGNAFVY